MLLELMSTRLDLDRPSDGKGGGTDQTGAPEVASKRLKAATSPGLVAPE